MIQSPKTDVFIQLKAPYFIVQEYFHTDKEHRLALEVNFQAQRYTRKKDKVFENVDIHGLLLC